MFFHRQRGPKWSAIKENPKAGPDRSWWEFHSAATAFGLGAGFTRDDVELAFRKLARKAHPDVGGTRDAFQNLITQRDLLLSEVDERRSSMIRAECPYVQ